MFDGVTNNRGGKIEGSGHGSAAVVDLLILQHREPVRWDPAKIGTVAQLAQGGGAVTIKNKELSRITKYKELKLHKL